MSTSSSKSFQRKAKRNGRRFNRASKLSAKSSAMQEKQLRRNVRNYKLAAAGRGANIFISVVFCILLGIALMRVSMGKFQIPTFTELLNIVADVPVPEINFLDMAVTDLGDWGMFSFLKEIFVGITRIVDCVLFFINGILSILTYVFYFVGWIFGL